MRPLFLYNILWKDTNNIFQAQLFIIDQKELYAHVKNTHKVCILTIVYYIYISQVICLE
jgi:hypothetical protein